MANSILFSQEKTLNLSSKLSKDLLGYALFTALSKSAVLLLLPILTRLFSEDEYGTYDLILCISAVSSIFISLSLESALVRFWSLKGEPYLNSEKFMTCLVTICLVGFSIILISFFLTRFYFLFSSNHLKSLELIPIAITASVFQILFNLSNICFRMRREITKFSLLSIFYTISYVGFSLFLIVQKDFGISGLFYGSLAAGIFSLCISLFLNSDLLGFNYSFKLLFSFLKYSVPTIPGVFTSFVNARADRLIILHFIGLASVGIYAAVFTYTSIIQVMVSIFRNAWMPHSISALDEDVETRNKIYISVLHHYLVIFFALAFLFVLSSGLFLGILLPPEYQSGAVVVPWLVGGAVLHGASCVANVGTVVTKKTIGNSYASVLSLISNIVCSLLLIDKYGLKGAAVGTFISELLFFVFLLVLSRKQITIKFNSLLVGFIIGSYSVFCVWLTFY